MTRDEYERDIWAGGETASFVPFKRDAGFGRWEPKIATCHGNVDYVLNPIRNSPHGDADQNTAEFNMLKIHREKWASSADVMDLLCLMDDRLDKLR